MYINTESFFHSRLMRLGLQCNDSTLQYCNPATPCSGVNCAYSIQELFETFRIDVYFAGHVHTYERMFPISSNTTYEVQDDSVYTNPQHPVYVVSGAAGTQTTLDSSTSEIIKNNPVLPTVVSSGGYSFSSFRVFNFTHLELTQIDVSTGKTVDSFYIVKDASLPVVKKMASFSLSKDKETECN